MPNKAFRTKSECRHYDLRVFHYSSGPRFPDLLSKRSSDSGARGLSTFPLLVNYSPLRELPFVQLTQNIPNQNMLTFICVMHKRQRSGWLGGNLAWVCCPNIPLKKKRPWHAFYLVREHWHYSFLYVFRDSAVCVCPRNSQHSYGATVSTL